MRTGTTLVQGENLVLKGKLGSYLFFFIFARVFVTACGFPLEASLLIKTFRASYGLV
jgi:hypothetical protein